MHVSASPIILDIPSQPKTDDALFALLEALKVRGYRFITPTPASHARVLARDPQGDAADLRDVLGWSRPFRKGLLDPDLEQMLVAADAIDRCHDGRWKCRYRVSSLGDDLFLHSSYPTASQDAVFFGPDSYRFADLVRRELARLSPPLGSHLADIGTGAGVGAIAAARVCPGLKLTMADINDAALRLARVNARAARIAAEVAYGPNLDAVHDPIDLALANPPYIVDTRSRDYRDGGDMHGGQVAYDMAVAALARLAARGTFILYTGSAILRGQDPLREALGALAARQNCDLRYHEIDPDVFGEELERESYADVDRIALVSAVFTRCSV